MSEILAPAGGKNSAIAAINAGADAIYLGLDKFSARSSAENFNEQEFLNILKYAHAFGVKVYVALNTVVKECELEKFFETAVYVWNSGADAIIIQDLFLGKYLKQNFPQMKLHLSTQAGTCNVLGAELAKQFGFDRVILARETKLEDIQAIAEIIEAEVFVQGALCTCFSGQCYMSSFAGGNSGNRGKCKQPCRKLYSIDRKGFEQSAYRISLSDLCVGEDIEKLIEAGVSSFKIEGRMRRAEYVAAAVSFYRQIIDGNSADIGSLKRTYNRGNYTKGLAFGQDKSFISSAVQGHIGEFAGIIKVENSKYICQSAMRFTWGDGFKILRAGTEVGGGIYGGEVKGGFVINTRSRLKNGDKVFITTDTALNERLLEIGRTIPIKIKICLNSGEKAVAEIDGFKIYSDSLLEPAKSRPLSAEEIIRCFNKVDGYPFKPQCEVSTDGVFAAASVLNAFRRKVYEEYYNKLTQHQNQTITKTVKLSEHKPCTNGKTAIIAGNLNGVSADIGILKLNDFSEDPAPLIGKFKGEKYLYVPPYVTGAELDNISEKAKSFDGIYCDGYFGIKLAEKCGIPLFAGTGLNITNSVSLNMCSAKYVCLSKELTSFEANALSKANAFYLTQGNIKVMDLVYCPFEKKCSSCDRRERYTLTDGEGRKFPVRRYRVSDCRFEVYNCANLVTNGSSAGALIDRTLTKEPSGVTRGHSVNGIY